MTINAKKTTYTIFQMLTTEQSAVLKSEGRTLEKDTSSANLGVTFDPNNCMEEPSYENPKERNPEDNTSKETSSNSWGAKKVSYRRRTQDMYVHYLRMEWQLLEQ